MDPAQTNLLESILDDVGQHFQPKATASPHFSPLVSTDKELLHEMEDIHDLFEAAPQTGYSVFREQRICSYEVPQLKAEKSPTVSSPAAAEMFRGAFDYVPNNQPAMYNPFPGPMNPLQAPMWSPPSRDFPPAYYPNPQNFYGFSSSGTRVWDGRPPVHFDPRPPLYPYMMNMAFLPPSHHIRFSPGPCMPINMPEFWHGAFFPPRQPFFIPEVVPGWCTCLPMGPFYQTCRPALVHRGRDNMVANRTPTSEDGSKAEEEGQVFAPDRTKEHGRYVSSEAHVAFLDQLKTHWTWEDNKNVSCSLCPKRQENVWKEKKIKHERSTKEIPATANSSFTDNLEDPSSDADSSRNEDRDDLNAIQPSDLYTFEPFTLDDMQSIIEDTMDPRFENDGNETPPPAAEIERIIHYLLADAPITDYEPNSLQHEQDFSDKEELKNSSGSSSPLQQSPIEESADQYRFCPLDNRFEQEVAGDDRKRRHERNSKKHCSKRRKNEGTARVKNILDDGKSNVCMVFRCSQGEQSHTHDSEESGYALRNVEGWNPDDNFTPQKNPPKESKQRKQKPVKRQLFKTELKDYKTRPDRAKQHIEMAVKQEPQNYTNQRHESTGPTGKPLDFCRRMGMAWTMLSDIKEEPREGERGAITKTLRRKTQSKNTDERVEPAQRKTKISKATSKKDDVYEDPGEPLLPQSPVKRGRTRQKKHETTPPVKVSKKTTAKVSGSHFPPAQAVKSKKAQTGDKRGQKALKDKKEPKCPSCRTKKPPSKKAAEIVPDPSLFLCQILTELHKQQRSDQKPKGSQRKGNRVRVEPEPSTEQSEDEEAEELSVSTAKRPQQRRNAPKKRKGGANETAERLGSGPAKKHRDSQEIRDKLRIKEEGGRLRSTWHT